MSLREVTFNDREQGEIRLLISAPTLSDPWGIMGSLRGTEWEPLIQVVSGQALSHALHGWATPLVRELGISARHRARRISEEGGRCALHQECLSASPECHPKSRKVPDCYEAPNVTPGGSLAASRVVLAWRENRVVVVIAGEEHNLS